EVHVVDLRLADELQALLPRHRRQGAVADRLRPVPEALDHRLDVERVTHAVHGNGRPPAGRTPAGRRSAPAGGVPVQVRVVAGRPARRPRRRGPGRAAVGLGAHAAPRAVGAGPDPGVAGQAAGALPRRRPLGTGAPIATTPDAGVLVPAGQAPARGRGRHAFAAAVAGTPARVGGAAPGTGPRRGAERHGGVRDLGVGRLVPEGVALTATTPPPARCVLPGTGSGRGRRRPGRGTVRVGRAGGPAPPPGRLVLARRLVVAVLVVEVEVGPREQPVAPGQHRDEHADHRQGDDDHPDRPALVVGAARGELRRGRGRRLGVLVDAVARDEQVVDRREGQLADRLGSHFDDLDVVVLVLPGRRPGGRRRLLLVLDGRRRCRRLGSRRRG